MPERSPEEQIEDLKQRKRDYVACFSTAEGKRVLADLESMCYINRTTFTPNDALRIALNEGQRFVVVHIKNMMSLDIKTLEKLKGE